MEIRREDERWRGMQQEKREGGQSRKRVKWKMHFFFVVGAHARAIVCLRVISLPNLFYPMEIRHPSECVCTCIYSSSVPFVCISVTCYCIVCMCVHA